MVTAARAFNRPYPVPPIIMAVVAEAASNRTPLAMEDWAAVGQADIKDGVLRVQSSQGAAVVAVEIFNGLKPVPVVRVAPASSSSATRRKPPSRRRARRVST